MDSLTCRSHDMRSRHVGGTLMNTSPPGTTVERQNPPIGDEVGIWQKIIRAIQDWRENRRHRCTFDTLQVSEKGVPERFRQRKFDDRNLPRDAVPVTNKKKTWCLVKWEPPPADPNGGNAIGLQIWADNNAFIRSITGWGGKASVPWRAIIIGGIVAVAVIWFIMHGGLT